MPPPAAKAKIKIKAAAFRSLWSRSGLAKTATMLGTAIFLSVTLEPVRINFCSSDAGACGAVIFWKHVGHSITEPACDESHIICCPHTEQANLYSLMAVAKPFHIRAPAAIRILGFIIILILLQIRIGHDN